MREVAKVDRRFSLSSSFLSSCSSSFCPLPIPCLPFLTGLTRHHQLLLFFPLLSFVQRIPSSVGPTPPPSPQTLYLKRPCFLLDNTFIHSQQTHPATAFIPPRPPRPPRSPCSSKSSTQRTTPLSWPLTLAPPSRKCRENLYAVVWLSPTDPKQACLV